MAYCLHSLFRALGWLLAGLLATGIARAQGVGTANEFTQLEQMARDWVQPAMASAVGVDGGGTLRPEILMGTLDNRLRLAPCARIEPYLPPGTRLWGRSRVGLRCLEGPVRWNVFLPVTVKAWGPAWVVKRPISAGSVLVEDDAEIAEVDWAEQPYAVLANPERWVGQQAAYALHPGQALRQNMVRPTPAFGPGAQVRVSSAGAGFQVVVGGEALTAGIPGQSVRVRLPGGRIVTGKVRDGQTVEVQL
ncbi:MAG: flagellar basal body P-ring formation protein FlgA [Hydrogenophaga sp.]|nr:flagellar basal body P-ring formation protein FlgA [Hydrogenophaga sp.]